MHVSSSSLNLMIGRFRRSLARARSACGRLSESAWGQRVLKGGQGLFVVGIILYLAYQLTEIGWTKVWNSLPSTPWFYILLLAMYATLPAAEVVIYSKTWKAPGLRLLPALLRKRVLNNDVAGYSGEAYFYVWARRTLGLEHRTILTTLKDNAIISSMMSTSVAFILLGLFLLTGQIDLLYRYLPDEMSTIGAGLAVAVALIVVVFTFRRSLFSLPARLLGVIGLSHFGRFVLNNGFQILQWSLVIPSVALGNWITLIALYIVINQIPFVPSRNLIFMSAGVGLSGMLELPTAALASMLLAQNILDRLLNISVYVTTTAVSFDDAETIEDDVAEFEEAQATLESTDETDASALSPNAP